MARKLTLRNAAVEDADRVASVLDARADQTIAGFSICRHQGADGETLGWVSLVGVRPRLARTRTRTR